MFYQKGICCRCGNVTERANESGDPLSSQKSKATPQSKTTPIHNSTSTVTYCISQKLHPARDGNNSKEFEELFTLVEESKMEALLDKLDTLQVNLHKIRRKLSDDNYVTNLLQFSFGK